MVDLKAIRTRLNWTQTQLGDYLGVEYHTVMNWERGRTKPSPLAQRQIVRKLLKNPEVLELINQKMDEDLNSHQTAQDSNSGLLSSISRVLHRIRARF